NAARVKIHRTSWSLAGPARTVTRSDLRLTKRGTGRPLTEPVAMGSAALAEKDASARHAAMPANQRNGVIGSRITLQERRWRSDRAEGNGPWRSADLWPLSPGSAI